MVLNGGDADRLTSAAAELSGDVHTAAFDVTDGPSVAAGVADVEERVGPPPAWCGGGAHPRHHRFGGTYRFCAL